MVVATVKKIVDPHPLLKSPETLITKPLPREELPRSKDSATDETARIERDRINKGKIEDENSKKSLRVREVGHHAKVQQKLLSRLFLFLGAEGKK